MLIISIVCFVLAFACIGYYGYAANYAGIHSSFLGFWIMASIGFVFIGILFYLDYRNSIFDKIPLIIKIAVIIVISVLMIIFMTMEILIASKMFEKTDEKVDYVIVLGAQVRGDRITKSLAKRLDVAFSYWKDNPEAYIICTGGQGKGENLTEALAEKKYLLELGVPEENILLEENSVSTYENLKFSMNIINNPDCRIAIATNNFHVYRAMHLARYVGFKNVYGLAGKSDNHLLVNYMVREALALFKEFLIH